MIAPLNSKYLPVAQTGLRIAAGSAYFVHGSSKLLGWFGGMGPNGGGVELMSKFGAAGVIETVLGACLILGLATRLAAFIASGEMAVTYFWMHWAGSGSPWWWKNHGEVPLLFCFIWLVFAAWGAGPWSVDAMLARGKPDATAHR